MYELYTAAQMKRIDDTAIRERGIPSDALMERAARAIADKVLSLPMPGPGQEKETAVWFTSDGHSPTPEEQEQFRAQRQRSAVVFCGPGNNGGDGVAAARFLLQAGWRVKCVLVGKREKMTDDCREMERRLIAAGGVLEDFDPEDRGAFTGFDVAIDALFGVELNSPLRPDAARAARLMKEAGWTVSADLPSGIHADTGEALGAAVRADVTVTFSCGKPGLFVGRGAVHSGRVVVADIGIPADLLEEEDCGVQLVDGEMVADRLPKRPPDGHKGDFGKVFILAGSRGYTGAAALCARAAARGGVGLVTMAVPEEVYPIVAVKCDEAMVWPLSGDDGAALEKAAQCDAVLIGPGLGKGARARQLIRTLLERLTCPVILDADGLNIISEHIDELDKRQGLTILTPHDGEFARLSGCDLPITDRLGAARDFAAKHHCVVVLKGHRTITAAWNGACAVNTTGNSGMAKGGSGDVLAGLMAALLAQMNDPDAAAAAVWLHGRAGDLAAADKGEYGMLPSDLIEQIPYAIKELTLR